MFFPLEPQVTKQPCTYVITPYQKKKKRKKSPLNGLNGHFQPRGENDIKPPKKGKK